MYKYLRKYTSKDVRIFVFKHIDMGFTILIYIIKY